MADDRVPPQGDVDDVAPSEQRITGEMIEALRGTKGWVLLFGVLSFIGAGFMVLGGVGMILGSAFMGATGAPRGGPPPAAMATIGAVYLVLAAVYIFPGWLLIKYSSAIGRLVRSGQARDMEDALHQQRRFWRFLGVFMVVMVGLGIAGVIAAIAIPAFMMAKGGIS